MRTLFLLLAACALAPGCGSERTVPAPARPAAASMRTAIADGLDWFARAQEEDGSFSLHRWNPHHGRPGLPGFSEEDHWFDVAATGLVILTYVEAGHASVTSQEDSCYRRALDWLLTKQRDGGRFGYGEGRVDHYFVTRIHKRGLSHPEGPGYKALTIHMFNHAVATAAVAAAYEVSRDDELRRPLKQALLHLVNDEHPEFVWTSYYDPFGDMGVVPYVLLAATAAADAGLSLEAEPLLEPAGDFLERVTQEGTGRARMFSEHPHCFDGHDSTAINAFCRRLLGENPTTGLLSAALGSIAHVGLVWRAPQHLDPAHGIDEPLGAVVNHELWYHGVRAFHGVSTQAAARFTHTVLALLVEHQRRSGSVHGSWDPIGVWDRIGGRIYSTAMAVRTLASSTRPRRNDTAARH